MRTRITPNTGIFYAVYNNMLIQISFSKRNFQKYWPPVFSPLNGDKVKNRHIKLFKYTCVLAGMWGKVLVQSASRFKDADAGAGKLSRTEAYNAVRTIDDLHKVLEKSGLQFLWTSTYYNKHPACETFKGTKKAAQESYRRSLHHGICQLSD